VSTLPAASAARHHELRVDAGAALGMLIADLDLV
jgi:hypothetical protein